MLNEELKIKIIQYLDGELDQGAENEIEEILDSNDEANDFCNQMKSLNINLEEFTHTGEYQAYSKKADALIDSVVEKHVGSKKASNNLSFLGFFSPQNVSGYALTAALFLSIGIFYDEYLLDDTEDSLAPPLTISPLNLSLDEYKGSPIILEFFKTRSSSSSELVQMLDDIIIESLQELTNLKSRVATIIYGSESYRLELTNKIINLNGVICYEGTLFKDNKKEFIFCNNNNNFSIYFK